MSTNSTIQFSLRTLFFTTTIVGLNAAASVSGNMWMISLSLIATSLLVSLVLVVFFRFASVTAASIAVACCIFHCGLWGAFQSIYLLVFAPERASMSIGLGNPISAGIVGILFGVPIATIVFLMSLIVGFVINKYRAKETPFESI